MGIAYGAYPEEGARLTKTGLPVKKLEREYPYFLGAGQRAVSRGPGSRAGGRLQIYHALLPEYCGKTFFSKKPRHWKREIAGRLVGEARERAMVRWDCREQLWAPELGENKDEIPKELWAACLYRCRPFDRIYISLGEENGEYELRRVWELLLPYLPRMRQVMLAEEESDVSLMLESWLLEEFGIVMMRTDAVSPNWPWLDLREERVEGSLWEQDGKSSTRNTSLVRAASYVAGGADSAGLSEKADKFRHINRREVLKFLDTAVKNGYNTKVN